MQSDDIAEIYANLSAAIQAEITELEAEAELVSKAHAYKLATDRRGRILGLRVALELVEKHLGIPSKP